MTFCDNLLKSFSENLKQLKKLMIFYYFCVFMKTVGFCTFSIADMNSACKNTLVSLYLLNFHRKAQFRLILSKAIALQFSRFSQKFKISNFALFVFFSI